MAQIIGNESDTTTKAVPNPTSLAAQVLGNPTIRQKIVSRYYNPYNIYHMRALLSLYAIGMLPQEELKEHIARRYLAVRCGVHLQKDKAVDFRYHRKMYVNLDTEDWQMELDEMCIDYDEELSKEEFEKMAEYRALRYIPSHVYETIKNGSQALAVFNKGKCTAEDLEQAFSCPELTQIYACQVGAVYPILARMMNKTGIPMSYQDQDDRCLLHYACEFGHAHLVAPIFREGVKEGINVAQVKDGDYWTPLMLACRFGRLNIVTYLVKRAGASVRCRDVYNSDSPLSIACRHGHVAIVEYLVSLGKINVNVKFDGNTVLALAIAYNHLDVVKVLVKKGKADLNATNCEGFNALLMAAGHGKRDIVAFLVEECHADVEARESHGRTALLQAAFYWKYDVVKYLVESAKARVDVRDGEGNTAMDYALKDKVTKLVDYLKGLEENNASLSNKRIKTEA
ncbi:Receptor-interacting serine/threonine-protein kinase 4 [Picochlorum sp. SENEW3]|nr:Receptor-interacting serine/threonine-protein kinase 4 [Picochlorum sp. SENEW3]